MALLEIQDLQIEFGQGAQALRAVDGVSLSLEAGETLCVVGESGSGKSLTALSIARLVPTPPARYTGGSIRLDGREVLAMSNAQLRDIRGRVVSYVFQEPGASLNPVFRVGWQIKETLKLHRPQAATDAEVVRLLQQVGIPAPEQRRINYPHELSGGMQQRVMIAMAIAASPRLLVADEPTTALDVTIQAQILELLQQLKRDLKMSILLITHNLGIVAEIADRLVVMYAGQVVEAGPAAQVLARPRHPYTRALLDSVPALGGRRERLCSIPGSVPQLAALPTGCRFHPRCPSVQPSCAKQPPLLQSVAAEHAVRCPYPLNHAER